MTKWLLVVIAALLLSISAVGFAYKKQGERVGFLTAQINSLTEQVKWAAERAKRDRATLVARDAKIAAQARKLAEAQEGLQKALQANKEWSDTNVPTDVQKAILGGSDASSGSPI